MGTPERRQECRWKSKADEKTRAVWHPADTYSEPAAMSRYEASAAVSTPAGMTMLMTFSADQFLSY